MAKNPEYNQYYGTPRKIHDRAVDKYQHKYERLQVQLRILLGQLEVIQEFLAQSPHGSAYELFLEQKAAANLASGP